MSSWRESLTPAGCNFVHKDDIWKDHVSKEFRDHKKWPGKWGYLTQLYRERFSSMPQDPAKTNMMQQAREPPHKPRNVTNRGTLLPPLPLPGQPTQSHTPALRHVQGIEAKRAHGESRYNYNDSMKKGGGYPLTSAGEIGWRCKQLEGFGMEQLAKRKKSFRKTLNWPRQEWPPQ